MKRGSPHRSALRGEWPLPVDCWSLVRNAMQCYLCRCVVGLISSSCSSLRPGGERAERPSPVDILDVPTVFSNRSPLPTNAKIIQTTHAHGLYTNKLKTVGLQDSWGLCLLYRSMWTRRFNPCARSGRSWSWFRPGLFYNSMYLCLLSAPMKDGGDRRFACLLWILCFASGREEEIVFFC